MRDRFGEISGEVFDGLARSGRFAPVALGSSEERLFGDCDLASMAENRLGDRSDPRGIDAARRAEWEARATDERLYLPSRRAELERCLWLLDEGERAGTLAVGTSTLGSTRVHVSSLYVMPDRRGRGIARGALGALRDALTAHGLDIRLDTSWCWQPAVALYLRMGMWVHMWKRDLALRWCAEDPAPLVEVGERRATFSVVLDGAPTVLLEATREGDVLCFDESALAGDDEERRRLCLDATSTFALALAMHGWPLVRSGEQWRRFYWADGGPPEALAYKITIWEAWSRSRGWRVETPRIPGLEYPSWAELEARWKREEE